MKKLSLICGFAVCSALCFSSCNKNRVEVTKDGSDSDSDQSSGSDTEYVQPVIWTGPGWYYGIWFSTEVDFNTWNHHHYHYHDHDHHDHHSDHHDRHRDGGNAHPRNNSNSGRHSNAGNHPNAGNHRGGGGGGGGGHHEKGHK